MTASTVLFRCDASPTIGAGHVVRCLALARVMEARGWRVSFAVNEEAEQVIPALRGEACVGVPQAYSTDAGWLGARLESGVDLIVVDHYKLGASFEKAARAWASRTAVIDDLGDRNHDADILIDAVLDCQTRGSGELSSGHTAYLIGADFVMLRPPFARTRRRLPRQRHIGDPIRVLVSMGATDSGNASALVLDALQHVETRTEVTVVLGMAAPHIRAIRDRIDHVPYPCNLLQGVEAVEDVIAGHDVVVGASGMGAWERCCLGVPSLVLLTATNQERSAKFLSAAGAVLCLGYAEAQAPRQLGNMLDEIVKDRGGLRRMGERGAMLCDGLGTYRVANVLDAPLISSSGRQIILRPVRQSDSDQVLEWQCYSNAEYYTSAPRPSDREAQDRWIRCQLSDPRVISHVILCDEEPSGLITLEWTGQHYEISILVAPSLSHAKLACVALKLACSLVPDDDLVAEVPEGNHVSHDLFRKAGFHLSAPGHYVLSPMAAGA